MRTFYVFFHGHSRRGLCGGELHASRHRNVSSGRWSSWRIIYHMNLCSPTMRGYAEVTREGHLTRDRCCQAVVHHPHRYTPFSAASVDSAAPRCLPRSEPLCSTPRVRRCLPCPRAGRREHNQDGSTHAAARMRERLCESCARSSRRA